MEKNKKKIVLTEEAQFKLDLIFSHTATNFSFELAIETIKEIYKSIEGLASHPRLGRTSNIPETRQLVVAGNIILYKIEESEIVVTTVFPRKTYQRK